MGWVIGIVLGALALDVAVRIVAVKRVLRHFEDRPRFNVRPAQPDPDAEEIWIPTPDGLTLRGSLYRHAGGPARGRIVFCPEMTGSHWSALSYCAGLWDAGFDILSFDFRNQGESDSQPGYDPLHWLTEYEVRDVLAAIAFARTRDGLRDLPLGLFGVSRGGGAALTAAARSADVRCVACEGAFTTESMMLHFTLRWARLYIPDWILWLLPEWHVRQTLAMVRWVSQSRRNCRYTHVERWLPKLRTRPVLLIAGGRDTYVDPGIAEEIGRRIAGAETDLWVVPEAKHNLAREIAPGEYDRRLIAFFGRLAAAPTGAAGAPVPQA